MDPFCNDIRFEHFDCCLIECQVFRKSTDITIIGRINVRNPVFSGNFSVVSRVPNIIKSMNIRM